MLLTKPVIIDSTFGPLHHPPHAPAHQHRDPATNNEDGDGGNHLESPGGRDILYLQPQLAGFFNTGGHDFRHHLCHVQRFCNCFGISHDLFLFGGFGFVRILNVVCTETKLVITVFAVNLTRPDARPVLTSSIRPYTRPIPASLPAPAGTAPHPPRCSSRR